MQTLERILYVDDAPDMRMLVQMALECTGEIAVTACENADGLADKIIESSPQMILLDVVMPEKSGPEILKQLKSDERFAHIPVAFLTSRTSTADVELFTGMGAIGVIAKSFNPATLAREVQAMWAKDKPSPFVRKAASYEDSYKNLHETFVAGVRDTVAELNGALTQFEKWRMDRSMMDKTMHVAHRLSGSAAAFGFPDLAVRARQLDQYLDRHMDDMTATAQTELQRLTADLIQACRRILDD